MERRKRVGVMTGAFNPIHLGHLIVAENAYELYDLDEVLFVPSNTAIMKEDMLEPKTRITMTGISIEDNSHFALSTMEIERGGNSYSYETIKDLKAANPDTDYFFIVGADAAMMMDKWMYPEKIFSEVTVLVAERNGYPKEALAWKLQQYRDNYNANIETLKMSSVDISSSVIKNV